jgi:hypothetical protein
MFLITTTHSLAEVLRRKKAIAAMKKLRGSGNGNLLDVLLEDRQKDNLPYKRGRR